MVAVPPSAVLGEPPNLPARAILAPEIGALGRPESAAVEAPLVEAPLSEKAAFESARLFDNVGAHALGGAPQSPDQGPLSWRTSLSMSLSRPIRSAAKAVRAVLGKDDPLDKALSERDSRLSNELLRAVRRAREAASGSEAKRGLDAAAMAIFSGRYGKAAGIVRGLLADAPAAEGREDEFAASVSAVIERLPARDLKYASALSAAAEELVAGASGDPFKIQARLSRLVHGLAAAASPEPLARLQTTIAKKASAIARERGLARRGEATGPVQKYNDCWIRSIYDLPIPHLDRLRKTMSYPRFLERVEAGFPESKLRRDGLDFEEFPKLLALLGLSRTQHLVDEAELVRLLKRNKAVLAALAWFDTDASAMNVFEAMAHFHQHAVMITDVKGEHFVVRDPAVTHETRYTMVELNMLQLVVDEVAPSGPDAARTLEKFLQASRGT